MKRRCLCPCHLGSIEDAKRDDGVDVADVIEAAVACDTCRNHHCPALRRTRLANAPELRPRIVTPAPAFKPEPTND